MLGVLKELDRLAREIVGALFVLLGLALDWLSEECVCFGAWLADQELIEDDEETDDEDDDDDDTGYGARQPVVGRS